MNLRSSCAAVVLALACAAPGVARAEDPAAPAASAPASSAAPVPSAAGQGVAVVGGPGVRDEAFLLARSVYATHLRPRRLDESRARLLAGEPPTDATKPDARELAELRAGVVGDDAASRAVLASLAKRVDAAALLVVFREPAPEGSTGAVVARLFLADSGELDAARYAPSPDPSTGTPSWRATVASLERRFPPPPVAAPPEPAAPKPRPFQIEPRKSEESKPFYTSPWLWGGLGAAALLGGIFYIASRDTSASPIHLQMQLPR